MHAVRTQCEVLDVGKYSNPSFGPFHKFLVPYQSCFGFPSTRMWHQNLGRVQGDSRTEMLKIIDRYGHVHNCREVSVVMVARRLPIANTRWWRVDTRTGQFFFDDAVGYNCNHKYRWTPGQPYGTDIFQSSP